MLTSGTICNLKWNQKSEKQVNICKRPLYIHTADSSNTGDDLVQVWLAALRETDKQESTEQHLICEDHFLPEDISKNGVNSDAIPIMPPCLDGPMGMISPWGAESSEEEDQWGGGNDDDVEDDAPAYVEPLAPEPPPPIEPPAVDPPQQVRKTDLTCIFTQNIHENAW